MNHVSKKSLIVSYFLLPFLPVFSFAQVVEEGKSQLFEVSGQVRVRSESRNEITFMGSASPFLLRARPDISITPSEEAFVFFQPQFSKSFGDMSYPLGGTNAQLTSGSFLDSALNVHQAYFRYHPSKEFSLFAGRQVFSYGDEILIGGGLGWHNVGRSFDAIRVKTEYSGGSIDLFYSKLLDADIFNHNPNDRDFYGIYNTWNVGLFSGVFDLYGFYLYDKVLNSRLWTFGTRLKTSTQPVDVRAEIDLQLDRESNGGVQYNNQADLEFGYHLLEHSRMRVAVGGFISSANFNQLFTAAHAYLGAADIFGRRNISGLFFKWVSRPSSHLTLRADVLNFQRTTSDFPAYQLNGILPLGKAKGSDSLSIGTEIDFNARFELSKVTVATIGTSFLLSGDYLLSQYGNRYPFFFFTEMEVKF